MSTKNDPGTFDCYANAEPDEPMFVLLGRDKHAPMLVELWAAMRELDGEHSTKIDEAVFCADSMRLWRMEKRPVARTIEPGAGSRFTVGDLKGI